MTTHATLGASNAHRWLVCPGSVAAEDGLPNISSPFAEEGTEAHNLAEMALHVGQTALDAYANREMADFVQMYVDYVNAASKGNALIVEERVSYGDWVKDGFGTADAIVVGDDTLHVIDLKYGMGVRVDAEENPQAMLYGLGAYSQFEHLADFKRVKITIVQPRLDHISEWEISVPDLLRWAEWVKQRAEATQDPDAPRLPGEKQCRFCRGKLSCAALKTMTEDAIMSSFDDLDNMPKANTLTPDQMRKALDAKPLIEAWLSAIEAQAKAALTSGENFPGYKLVEGRANRKWIGDTRAVEKRLTDLLDTKAFTEPTLISPAQAEKALGKAKAAVIADLITKPQGSPTLAREDDKRPTIGATIDDFSVVDD